MAKQTVLLSVNRGQIGLEARMQSDRYWDVRGSVGVGDRIFVLGRPTEATVVSGLVESRHRRGLEGAVLPLGGDAEYERRPNGVLLTMWASLGAAPLRA